ncbi:MAG: hydroxylamine reductase [archaeon]|nr:hydroxylamine reductase [archaeon]
MLCRQCEETVVGTGCTKNGVCGKTAEIAEKQDLLIGTLIELAASDHVCIHMGERLSEGLFMTLSNTNFDGERFDNIRNRITKTLGLKDVRVKCITDLDTDDDLRSLKELLLYGLKGLAAYYHHARVLGYTDGSIEKFMRKGLASMVENKTAEELVALNMECGAVGATCLALLDKANTETFGTPGIATVSTGVRDNPAILVTGHDLNDLRQILEQTQGTGIDVYTNGEMLVANSYPELRKYGNLVGNYGGAWYSQREEFESFNGPIVATTNSVLTPKESYKDRLFTTGPAGIPGVEHIGMVDGKKDFSKVIELAKKCQPPTKIDDTELTIGFGHSQVLALADKIVDAVKSGAIRRFVVMAGCDGREKGRTYYREFAESLPKDTVILTAGCAKYRFNKLDLGDIGGIPRVIDAGQCNDCYSLVVIANALAEAFGTDVNGLPLSFNISWYEQKAVLVLLTLLNLGVKNIMLGPRLPAFITPNILKVLVDTFGIKANGDVRTDMVTLNIE